MKKLLASDLDGTLIHNGEIKQCDKESILKLKKSNNIFGVSTGRPYKGITSLINEHGIDIDFYVLLNGAYILDKDLNVLKRELIPYHIIKTIFEKYDNYTLFGVEEGMQTSLLYVETVFCWDDIYRRTIDELENKECLLLSIHFANNKIEEIDEICNEINREFSQDVVAYRNAQFVDVVPKGCSKGNGVKQVCEMMNISMDNVYTIGDSFNDVSMFNITKNSFSFPNVEEKLKEHVNFIVDSVSECIEKHILGE